MNLLRLLAVLLHDGSLLLARRAAPLARWVRQARGPVDLAVRAAMVLVPAYIAVRIVRAHPRLMWPIAILWCWAAIRAARKGPRQPLAPAAAAAPEPAADEAADVSPEAFLCLLRNAIGPHRAVHLVTLVERLAEQHPGRPWDTAAVRDLCTAAGVPVRDAVRVPKQGVRVGVHRDDLPLLPSSTTAPPPGPVVDVVSAGQHGPTTAATTSPTTAATPDGPAAGEGFEVVDDPTNPARALVTWPS